MKKLSYLALISLAFIFLACQNSSESLGDGIDIDETINNLMTPKITSEARRYEDKVDELELEIGSSLTVTVTYPMSKLVTYNYSYPYLTPSGKFVTLSGAISIPTSLIDSDDKEAWGIVLYNHYTIMTNEECPSMVAPEEISALNLSVTLGETSIETYLNKNGLDHKLIIVSPDLYGFGTTKDQVQYYCQAMYNARCTLEGLKAAQYLLRQMGYTWGDYLLNIGYSQGAQTAIANLKLVDSGEYDFDFSATFAGSGPYDLETTLDSYIANSTHFDETAVGIYPFISFNYHENLGYSYSDFFNDPLPDYIDDWFLSKAYIRVDLDKMIIDQAGLANIGAVYSTAVQDSTTEISQNIRSAIAQVDLTTGWTPASNHRIALYHSEDDNLVPYSNYEQLRDLLAASGYTIDAQNYGASDTPLLLFTQLLNMMAPSDGNSQYTHFYATENEPLIRTLESYAHEDGGTIWMLDVVNEIQHQFKDKVNSDSSN